ncbi:MAG: hypothetical protein K2K93_01955, partial [Muribaculaceae bacterium]|nr:hypothetical protein [Muribaculaceae bacterium]
SEKREKAPVPEATSSPAGVMTEMYPFWQLERNIIYYTIRYGMLDFCEVEYDDGTVKEFNTVEYVTYELQSDDIWFGIPAYAKTFNRILDLRDDFVSDHEDFLSALAKEREELLRKGYDEIGARASSMDEIRREERKLEARIDDEMEKRRFDFERYYVEQRLSSHHDDDVRRTVTEAINSETPLSNIYMRNNPVNERQADIDRMHLLVEHGMLEWKNELLNRKIREKMRMLESLPEGTDAKKVERILMETQALMEKRSELAKALGDRTIGGKFK